LIRRAAVLGAGTMGSRIAAHLASAGIAVHLLDLPAREGASESLAAAALKALAKAKPPTFYEPAAAALITAGDFEHDLHRLSECDWVVEAVAENFEIKAALLPRVASHLASHAILTTNTSGLPISRLAAVVPGVRRRFFGTHFFNPPRHMRLMEVIPAAETDPALVAGFAAFADRILGKEVVFANDTPNFIANRIGAFLAFAAGNLVLAQGLTVEEADALTGPVLGWPRTGTFRLADLIGLDVLYSIAANFPEGVKEGRYQTLMQELVKRGWTGDKAKQGFYKKVRGTDGKEERLALDLATLEYRPTQKPSLPGLDAAKNAASIGERLRMLLAADPEKDKAAAFLWPLLAAIWNYSADRIGEVAAQLSAIDAAFRGGYNWEFGPFEMWDAAGVEWTVSRMEAMGLGVSSRAKELLAAGQPSWYAREGRECFQPATGRLETVPVAPGHARVADFRRLRDVVRSNAGASLVDLGDGVACIELHSLKTAIGGDVLSFISSVLNPSSDAIRDFSAFIVSGDRQNFSVGANLMQMLLIIQEGDWDELNALLCAFQQMTASIKFCPRPVIVAPFGLALGAGAEICLHAFRRQPHAETYIGLVESGVGLLPAGGGVKEMLLRAIDAAAALAQPDPRDPPSRFAQSAELMTALRRNFENMALAKVSSSAADARSLGFFSPADRITMNRERLLLEAKAEAQALAAGGYVPPQPRMQIPAPGAPALAALETGISQMGEAGLASEYDRKIAGLIANVLCGGPVSAGTLVSEQHILDLEREAFLKLAGERKTHERIAHTLKTGKPLRN
jgi:3-hydroxyacyl-CoA dehydrogenase